MLPWPYSQCFVTAPLTMLIALAAAIGRAGGESSAIIGALVMAGGVVWYLAQQALWFRAKLGSGLMTAAINAVGAALVAGALIITAAFAVIVAGGAYPA